MGNLRLSTLLLGVTFFLSQTVLSQIEEFTITSKATGTVLNANFTSELVVAVTQPDPVQQWYLYQWDPTTYFIVVYDPDVGAKQVVTCPANLGYNPVPDTLAQANLTNDPTNTYAHFNIVQNSDGSVTYVSVPYPTKVLDLQKSSANNSTPILCWEKNGVNGTANQHWLPNPCSLVNCS